MMATSPRPTMRHAIATVCLSGTLEEKLAAAAQAGFDGVEIFEPDLIGSHLAPAEIRERAAGLGLTIDLYQPFRDFEAVNPEQLQQNLRRAEAKFDVMEQLGATMLLACSNVTPEAIDDDKLAAAQLHQVAERAATRGMRVAYEALAWGRHVSEYDHAWRIVRAADHPALGLCLDSFHTLSRGTSLGALSQIPAQKLFFLQLADAPHLSMDVLHWSRHYRCFPGQGGFDLQTFLTRALDSGYSGPLSLEVFNDVFRQADPGRMAIDARRSLLILEESLPPHRRRTVAPTPSSLGGYAFVELAVEPASIGRTQQVLHALGFEASAQHRTKPVTLWQQSTVRVLLNAGAPTPPGVAAIALESADPSSSTERAEALLAPVLDRQRGPGEAELAAVAAPDGTAIFFCRSDAGTHAGGWLPDFESFPIPAHDTIQRIERIDHIALSQPFDYFDEAVLFYRSLLGLQPLESLELAAPTGLVRSRAVANREGTVRLVLNVPLLAPNTAEPAGFQHIAFSCTDIFAVSHQLRGRGITPLAMSGNYYADLAARTELTPVFIDSLQAHDVLYDGNPGAELLHLYTPVIGGRLFFEIIERRGTYSGYGASNAGARMAAQRSAAAHVSSAPVPAPA